jgi:hypothetical protein
MIDRGALGWIRPRRGDETPGFLRACRFAKEGSNARTSPDCLKVPINLSPPRTDEHNLRQPLPPSIPAVGPPDQLVANGQQ